MRAGKREEEKEEGKESEGGRRRGRSAVKLGYEGAWQSGESLRREGWNDSVMMEESKAPGDTEGSQMGRGPGPRKARKGSLTR